MVDEMIERFEALSPGKRIAAGLAAAVVAWVAMISIMVIGAVVASAVMGA